MREREREKTADHFLAILKLYLKSCNLQSRPNIVTCEVICEAQGFLKWGHS